MISVVNRMCFRCISGFFDPENKLRICNSYCSDLCSIWMIFALWNNNREVKLEVEFILYSSRYSWSCLIKQRIEIGHCRIGEVSEMPSNFTSFIRSWSLLLTASNEWVSMCIGILTRWVFIQCLKLLDEFSKMCSWMNEVHSNYSRQREAHRARRNVDNYSDLLTYRDKSQTEKRF